MKFYKNLIDSIFEILKFVLTSFSQYVVKEINYNFWENILNIS